MDSTKKKYLIVIAGPTAVGKSSLAISLAQHLDSDIISADSRQIYHELNIGTAKLQPDAMQNVTHHMINHISVTESYSAADYESDVMTILDSIYTSSNVAILCGGTGLYIKAILDGLDPTPKIPKAFYDQVEKESNNWPLNKLQAEISAADPKFYAKADIDNRRRLLRALAHIRYTGEKFSDYWNLQKVDRPFIPIAVRLTMDRAELYDRINQRVDAMMHDGLLNEVRRLMPLRQYRALQTVGYSELFSHLTGQYDLNRAIELIKRNSRRYAKRQMTWFRNQGEWQGYEPKQLDEIIAYINDIMHQE